MNKRAVHGFGRLAAEGVVGISHVVESLHARIVSNFLPTPDRDRLGGISGMVYRGVRGGARAAALALDLAMRVGGPAETAAADGRRLRRWRGVLNGVLGDHLDATGNPLALPMRFYLGRSPIDLDAEPVTETAPSDILLALHGLCMGPRQWRHHGHDHAALLAREFKLAPVYLEYNSGRHISDNGAELATALQRLVDSWPVPVSRIVILAHSMGGLVARSALHQATQLRLTWPGQVREVFFLGTPHQGAPLEVVGHQVDRQMRRLRYLAPFALIGGKRSAGITDLKRADMLAEDWQGRAERSALPLPSHVRAAVVAGVLDLPKTLPGKHWIGDGLVPKQSALGEHRNPRFQLQIPDDRQLIVSGAGHFDLLADLSVYAQLRRWLGGK